MPLDVKLEGGPAEASAQLIKVMTEKGLLPEDRSRAQVSDPCVPEISLTIKITKANEDTVP